MTRSSIKELFTPYEEPERVLHSTRKLFKTTSLDYSSSPEFDLFSDLEDQCEEEVAEIMGEPTEEYMTKNREDYRSGIARPKIDEKAHFELNGQFLKDLRDNTFSRLDNEDANEHIEKLTDMREVILFYKGLDIPTRQILDFKGAIPSMKAADAKKAIQDMADHSQKWHNGTNQGASIKALEIQIGQISKVLQERGSGSLPGSTEINPRDHVKSSRLLLKLTRPQYTVLIPSDTPYEEKMALVKLMDRKESATNLKRLLKEKLRMGYQNEASMNMHDLEIIKDSPPLKKKDPGSFTIPCHINNICFEKPLADLGASVSVMPYLTFTNLGLGELALTKLIIKLTDRIIKRPKGIPENVLVGIDKFVFPLDFIILDMPEDIKVFLILGRPFFSTAHVKIDVCKRKITLRVGDDKIVFKSDNPTSNIIRRVYVLGLRERMELNLEARLMGEALILNRSLNLVYGDYIELNDLNEPLELRRNQVEDLGLAIEEGEVIDEPMEDIVKTRNDDNEISNGIREYPSFYDFDRKIHIDCAYNLQFSCMIVVENIGAYCNEGIGDIIVGKPFCREICVKARSQYGEPSGRLKEFGDAYFLESMCVVVIPPIRRIHQGRYTYLCLKLHSASMKEDLYAISRRNPYAVLDCKS
ncbi:DNA/RNA polymerases superfamily protein [Tanacetum coccineum]